jgi:hypothetical protein
MNRKAFAPSAWVFDCGFPGAGIVDERDPRSEQQGRNERPRMSPLITLLLMGFAALAAAMPEGAQQAATGKASPVVLRGHIVCLDAAGKRPDAAAACDGPNHRYALLTSDGQLRTFSADDTSTAMFADARVRRRELQVTAQTDDKNQLEIVRVQSVRDGKLYDIYYFCELCNIRAYAPGLCPCCRNEMEFRETPAADQ